MNFRMNLNYPRKLGALSFVLLSSFAIALTQSNAYAVDEVDSIYLRVKGGPSFYSDVSSINMAPGIGLDVGFRTVWGYGLVGIGKFNFSTTGVDNSISGTRLDTSVKSLFLGAGPSYAVTKGIATMTFNLGLGVFSLTTQTDSTLTAAGGNVATHYPQTTQARFAICPGVELDFDLSASAFFNAGLQVILRLGDSPRPTVISPAVGLGIRF